MYAFKLTFVLLVLNVLTLVAVYWFTNPSIGPQAQYTADFNILGYEVTEIDEIIISESSFAEPRILRRTHEHWDIVHPIRWPANPFAVQRILAQLQFLETDDRFSVTTIEDSGQTLADYGLDEPQLTITFNSQGRSREFFIGAPKQIGQHVYVLSPDGEDILILNHNFCKAFTMDLEELRSQHIFSIPPFEVDTLSVQTTVPDTAKVRLTKNDGQWRFEVPIQARADNLQVEEAITQLAAASIVNFVDQHNVLASTLGLQNPRLCITIDAATQRQTLRIGNPVDPDEGNQYYAQLEGSDALFTVHIEPFSLLTQAEVNLRDRLLLNVQPEAITQLAVNHDSQSIVLQLLETGAWQKIVINEQHDPHPTPVDHDIIAKVLHQLTHLKAVVFVSDAPSAAALERYGLDKPQYTIKVTAPQQQNILLLGQLDPEDNLIYAKVSDHPFIYKIASIILDDIPADPLYYRARVLEEQPTTARIASVELRNIADNNIIFSHSLEDPQTNPWSAVIAQQPLAEQWALSAIIDQIREFRVRRYVSQYFSQEHALEANSIPWRYHLKATILLPDGQSFLNLQRDYYFTNRLANGLQIGGSLQHDITFSIEQELMDALVQLTTPAAIAE